MNKVDAKKTEERRLIIKDLISTGQYLDQQEILDALPHEHKVALSTVSRDLAKIGVKAKGRNEAYVLSDKDIQGRRERSLRELVDHEVLGIYKDLSFLGINAQAHTGPAVASAIEIVNYEGLICAIPTDSAVLLVFQEQDGMENKNANRVFERFQSWKSKQN